MNGLETGALFHVILYFSLPNLIDTKHQHSRPISPLFVFGNTTKYNHSKNVLLFS